MEGGGVNGLVVGFERTGVAGAGLIYLGGTF